jgi:hypothetical protein
MPEPKYKQVIASSQPGCVILLLDHSFSMREGMAGSKRPKVKVLASFVNRFLRQLIGLGNREKAKPFFDVGVIGYTTDAGGVAGVKSVLGGPLAGRNLVSLVELSEYPLEVLEQSKDDGTDDTSKVCEPIWYEEPPVETMGGTPMSAALERCRDVAQLWCARHPDSFPPLVIHVTDGEPTDTDPEPAARKLLAVATQDGNLLLCHLVLPGIRVDPLMLPADDRNLPDEYVRALFWTASPVPPRLRHMAAARGLPADPGARLLAVNTDLPRALLQLLDVGSNTVLPALPSAAEPDSIPPPGGRMPVRLRRCPRCDRQAHGNPGQRRCLACDHKF